MREYSIIFSSEMVKAILEGRKTQTRRVIKPQPKFNPPKVQEIWKCPYGKIGDRLWVKEKYYFGGNGIYYSDRDDGTVKIAYTSARFMPKKYARIWLKITNIRVERLQEISEADAIAEGVSEWANKDDIANDHYLERPLPEHWCKTCRGQGVHGALGCNLGVTEVDCGDCNTPVKLFRSLWDSLHKKDGFNWKSNPYVFVIEFKVR